MENPNDSDDAFDIKSSSSDEQIEMNAKLDPPKLQEKEVEAGKENKTNQSDSELSELDENIEEIQSEKQTSSQSQFQIEDQISDQQNQDKKDIYAKEKKYEAEIFDDENQEQNKEVQEDSGQITEEKMKEECIIGANRIKLRDVQKTLFQKSQDRNSIIYLPTGLGKTRIAIASMYYYLSYTQRKKIVFLANTIQLVKQQAEAIKKTLHGIIQDKNLCKQLNKKHSGNQIYLDWSWQRICKEVACIHGEKNDDIGTTKRKKIENNMSSKKQFLKKFQTSTVLVVISQIFLNCLRRGYINLSDFSFIVFDECHHCKGDHPYAGIMNEFYFDLKQKIEKDKSKATLPRIMGLTASPIAQPEKNDKKLQKLIEQLCINLDSNFAQYPKSDKGNETKIQIIEVKDEQENKHIPDLLNFFTRHSSHQISYRKLQFHFPLYFQCIKQVIDLMSNRHDCLKIDRSAKQIPQAELFFFYDIKQCLLNKIRDIWLQLGQFVMCLAFSDMITQLKNIKGLKSQENQQLKQDIIRILLKYEVLMRANFQYDKCSQKYFSAKLNKLIELLSPKQENKDDSENKNIQDNDLVLVFAFKRRTVEYLAKFFEKYKDKLPEEKRKYFDCTGVTGYSSRIYTRTRNQGEDFRSNPSAKVQKYQIDKDYEDYIKQYAEQFSNTTGVTAKLQNELNRFKNAKIGKYLLQTQQKYSSQLKKITQFRKKQKRVLISTSVTEEGFDIPGCNKVISFDTPFSMKAFIQIKGRARKNNSIYYIFTSSVNFKEMIENRQIYEDTINATYQIAINKIAKKDLKTVKRIKKQGYEKVPTKGGALLNTNYALQVLKIYFSTLAQPNKGYFHFLKTPSICYKAIIKMPQTDPSGIGFIQGDPLTSKQQALKSAAYKVVYKLKVMGLIKDDLKPSKLQQLQDQFQLQKYDDLGQLQRDQQYRQIFRTYAQFDQQQDKQNNKKYLKIYFQAIRPKQLTFTYINPNFNDKLVSFKKGQKFPFQLYMMQFSNTGNHLFMKQYDNSNQIGILTCFDNKFSQKLFSGYRYTFQQNPKQSFYLRSVSTPIYLTMQQYKIYQRVHLFLITGSDNKQIQYFFDKTKSIPTRPAWKQMFDARSNQIDNTHEFYPIMVLLKRKKNQKKQKIYEIDEVKVEKIKHHEKIFQQIYLFYNNNKLKNPKQIIKFPRDLSNQFISFSDRIKNNQTITLIQSISPDFVFQKCIIKNKTNFSQQISTESKKNHSKYNMQKRQSKYLQMFTHFKCENNEVVQRDLWNDYLKDKRLSFFDKGGIKQQITKSQRYYFLKEFIEYPVSPQTLLKVTLAKKYLYDGLDSYTKALSFLDVHLRQVFMTKNNKQYKPMYFNHYENIILANSETIFTYIAESGQSRFIKQIGRSYRLNSKQNNTNYMIKNTDKSIFKISDLSISGIDMNQSMNMTQFHNQSMVNQIKQNKKKEFQQEKLPFTTRIYQFDQKILSKINIQDIQKVLTSKTYKCFKGQNYEQFQFIGDVVLKFLATLQIFCTRPQAVQGEMHIARANIICNANLHRKSILNKVFRYIMASKNLQPCPPFKTIYNENKIQRQIYKGKNGQYESLGIYKTVKASEYQGYQYIPGKVHADVIQALIGAFYNSIDRQHRLEACQQLLYAFNVLQSPSLKIQINYAINTYNQHLPKCYSTLQQQIGYEFKSKGLLIQSLTHPTFKDIIESVLDDRNYKALNNSLNNSRDIIHNLNQSSKTIIQDYRTKSKSHQTFYQRLEFLGDSVLDLIVVQHLFEKYNKGLDQGTLSLLKQAGVSNKSLGLIALKFDLHKITLMNIPQLDNLQDQFRKLKTSFNDYISHPEKIKTIQINQIKLLGDVFQGLIGAIFIDNLFNYQRTKQIVWNMIGQYIKIFTDKKNIEGFSVLNFLTSNNYTNCRIQKISDKLKGGKFHYGLIDRKHTCIAECYADNEKDAYDIIIEKLQAKQKGIYIEDEDEDDDEDDVSEISDDDN